MMSKQTIFILLSLFIFVNSCSNFNRENIDLTNFETFFISLNELRQKNEKRDVIDEETEFLEHTPKSNKKNVQINKSIKKDIEKNLSKIKNNDKSMKKLKNKIFKVTDLKNQIGLDDTKLLKIFGKPSFKLKKGKVKVFQFHYQSCYMDLFFILKDSNYLFEHFDFRSPRIDGNYNAIECEREINKKINLKHHLD